MQIPFLTSILVAGLVAFAGTDESRAELTIVGQAAISANLANKDGLALPSTSRVEIGYYSSSLTRANFEAYTSASDFLTGWTALAVGTATWEAAPSTFYDGLFIISTTLATGVNTHVGKQMHILAGNAASISGSSQLGVFTSSSWIVPANPTGDVGESWSFDIETSLTAGTLFGSYVLGAGEYAGDGVVNEYRLQAVIPEPATGQLLLLGSLVLASFRRKLGRS